MTAIHRRVAVTALLGLLAGRALADANTDEFFRAIRQDNDAAVRSLLARGFNPNTKDEKGTPGLIVALQEGALRVASLLIDSPHLVPETRNAADESPLMMAALKGPVDLVRHLFARDADLSTRSPKRTSALGYPLLVKLRRPPRPTLTPLRSLFRGGGPRGQW
ncbi:MAG: hypothetical protein E6Q65_05725 [Ottowia sp.]|nr:MAG: hypothetical protein E6Q65_05725 [Ottowia sp.]